MIFDLQPSIERRVITVPLCGAGWTLSPPSRTPPLARRGSPKLVFQLREDKLRLAKPDLRDAAMAVNDSLRGRIGGEVLEGTERLPVLVRFSEQEWGTIDRIADIRIPVPRDPANPATTIGGIPLNAQGTPRQVPSQSPIIRIDGERYTKVQAA